MGAHSCKNGNSSNVRHKYLFYYFFYLGKYLSPIIYFSKIVSNSINVFNEWKWNLHGERVLFKLHVSLDFRMLLSRLLKQHALS